MFANSEAFTRSLRSWCAPNLTVAPANFSFNCPLPTNRLPIWGCGPEPPEAPPGLPPVGPPQPECTQTLPNYAINASCVNGTWVFIVPACDFFGTCPSAAPSGAPRAPASASVTVPIGSVISLTGNITISGVTLVVPVANGTTGQLRFKDCANFTGSLVVTVSQSGGLPPPGSSVDVLVADRPECSSLQPNETATVVGADPNNCSKLLGTVQQKSGTATKSLAVVFSLDTSGCAGPGASSSTGPTALGDSLVGPVVGGVVGGVVLVSAATAGAFYVFSARRRRRAQDELHRKLQQPANSEL